MTQLCQWDPNKRPTAVQALQHPYFAVGVRPALPVSNSPMSMEQRPNSHGVTNPQKDIAVIEDRNGMRGPKTWAETAPPLRQQDNQYSDQGKVVTVPAPAPGALSTMNLNLNLSPPLSTLLPRGNSFGGVAHLPSLSPNGGGNGANHLNPNATIGASLTLLAPPPLKAPGGGAGTPLPGLQHPVRTFSGKPPPAPSGGAISPSGGGASVPSPQQTRRTSNVGQLGDGVGGGLSVLASINLDHLKPPGAISGAPAPASLPPGVTRYNATGNSHGGGDGITNENRRAGLLPPPVKLGSLTARGGPTTNANVLNGPLANMFQQQQQLNANHGSGAAMGPGSHLPSLGSARLVGDPLMSGQPKGGPGAPGPLNGGSLRKGI
ncbi:hypothetical protein Vretifemale_18562 [Volvox reticuliferus]|nr:hypothetical protein Vretifemale_18562 [Volvox reticuliferus]